MNCRQCNEVLIGKNKKYCNSDCYRGWVKVIKSNCLGCKKIIIFRSSYPKKYCSQFCYNNYSRDKIRLLGLSNKKYSTDELKQRGLASWRKSYRKNIEKRLFYYRQLAFKRRNIGGSFSKKQWEEIIVNQNGKCLHCGTTDNLTIDHKIPISKWVEWVKDNPVHYKCNDIENIQALCGRCNCRKWNKL